MVKQSCHGLTAAAMIALGCPMQKVNGAKLPSIGDVFSLVEMIFKMQQNEGLKQT